MASRILALKGYGSTRFWLSALCIAVVPTSIGSQDIAALIAHRASSPQHSRRHLLASPFGTIEPATFSYGIRPIGTAMPRPPAVDLVNFDPRAGKARVWSLDQPVRLQQSSAEFNYPKVNRERKGNRLPIAHPAAAPANRPSLPQLQPISAPSTAEPVHPPVAPEAPAGPALPPLAPHAKAPSVVPAVEHRAAADIPAEVPASGQLAGPQLLTTASLAFADDSAQSRSAQIYFGAGMTDAPGELEAWAPGAEPVLATPSLDPGIKLAALEQSDADAALANEPPNPKSPAQRLGLTGPARVKAEKCLTEAVYFEARGEPLRGQQAVAQVVMNRVFSGYYPNNVCGVVFQNASHYLACQFTFACEHKDLSRIDEPDMWVQAKRIAKDELDGKIWLSDIGHATHYHATWVHPSWVHEMTKLYKLGVHTFYRPRAWGKGEYEPVWGTPPNTSKADAKAAPTS
ncbi:MAG: cell wall hydrolase [Xanthobacteraceae bacterium]